MSDVWGTVFAMERDRATGHDAASLRADIERLRVALLSCPCPRPANAVPETVAEWTIRDCRNRNECGCIFGDALDGRRQKPENLGNCPIDGRECDCIMSLPTSQPSFLSEIASGEPIPIGNLAYFRERFRDRLYELVVSEFLKKERAGQLTRAELARRIGRKPQQISRWLGAPGNWTLETVSDLLLAISKAELEFKLWSLEDRAAKNYSGPDWLQGKPPDIRAPASSNTTNTALPNGALILPPKASKTA